MADIPAIAQVLTHAHEAHAATYHYTRGEDDDWASFYSDWLVNHSPLGELLGKTPIRAHLTVALVELDERYLAESPDETWEEYYARDLAKRFGV